MLLCCLLIAAVNAAQGLGSPASLNAAQNPGSPAAVNVTQSPESRVPRRGQYNQTAYNDNTSLERSDDKLDDATTPIINVTHKPWTIQELEGIAYDKMCKSSCEHKCGHRKSRGGSHCYCDWACTRFGDCCLDYEASCLSGPKVTRDNYADILRSRKSGATRCVNIRQEPPRDEGEAIWLLPDSLLMISSCGGTITTDTVAIRHCERPPVMNRTLDTENPVMYRDVIYRNKYCAVCNNPDVNLTDMAMAGVVFSCVNTTGNVSDHWQRYDRDITYDQAISNCEIKFNLSNFANLWQDSSRYTCTLESDTHVCNSDITDPLFDFEYLQSTCRKYRARINHMYRRTFYNNPHCAMCSGLSDIHYLKCFLSSAKVSIAHMFTFKQPHYEVSYIPAVKYTYAKPCNDGTVFNHVTGLCVTLPCPAGHVALRDKGCARLNVTVPQMLSKKLDVRIYIVLSTVNEEFGRIDQELIIQDIGVDVVINSTRLDACNAFKMWNNWNDVISNSSTCLFYEAVSRNFNDVAFEVEWFSTKVKSRFNNSLKYDIFVLNQDATETTGTCINGSQQIQRDIYFLSNEHVPFRSTFLVVNTSQVYDVSDVPVIMAWRINHSNNTRWIKSFTALVCEPDIFSCDTVTFQADEYKDTGVSLVLYEGTLAEVEIPERSVLRLDSNAIVMCASQLSNLTGIRDIHREVRPTEVVVQEILTMIGNMLSLICLVFTIITYCMFVEIRTRAGKCIMNLCSALFFAQLSLQVNDEFVPYHAACVAVAVFQHYTWLVAFLWMNVLAFDVSCTFAVMKRSSGGRDTSRLRVFVLYAWGLPAVFVAVCLVIDFCTELPLGYGGKTMCWIADPGAIVYYFAAPLAAVISANGVLFVRAVVALRHATAIANTARQPVQQRTTFFIYVRLTSLMGFTWLFGFLANIDVLSFLWYPFIVCNTCQGVFICVSFTLTSRVRRLWRARCHENQSRSPNCTGSSQDIRLQDLTSKR